MSSDLLQLHAEVDRGADRLERAHADRLLCRIGCNECCVDGLTVFEVEAQRIRDRHARLLELGRPHPPGACAFLDERGACRIYEDRPYVCRTQGLPLRWIESDEAGVAVELRDICPLNDRPDEPLSTMPAEQCWTIGPIEGRLAAIQQAHDGGEMRRIELRDLFLSR